MSDSTSSLFDAELLLNQARTYLAFGEYMQQFTEQFQTDRQDETDWNAAVQQHLSRLKEAIAQSASDPNVDPELAKLWTSVLEIWQQTAASLGTALHGDTAVPRDDAQTEIWQACQQVQAEYLVRLQQTAKDALDLMESRLKAADTGNPPIDSLRRLYKLWVECNEETYGQMLRSADYSEFSGRLFNTLLRCYPRGDATS